MYDENQNPQKSPVLQGNRSQKLFRTVLKTLSDNFMTKQFPAIVKFDMEKM